MKLTPAFISGIASGDIREVKQLDLSGKEIKEMDDISCCVELKKLNLSKNQLTKLYGIGFNKEITWLNVASNRLSSLLGLQMMTKVCGALFIQIVIPLIFPFSHIAKLVLNAGYNEIKQIEGLDGMTQLKALMINNNKILRIEGLGMLRELNTLG